MALQTKTITANGSKGHHMFTLIVNEDSTNIETNKSSGTYTFQISPIQNGWDWYGHNIPFSGNIGETTFSGNISDYDGSSTVVLASGSFEIEHNTDGNKTMSISFSVIDNTGANYTCGDASASGEMTLTYIPRKTKFDSTSYGASIGQSNKITTVKPASPTFMHSLKVTYNDSFTKYINGTNGEWSDAEIIFPTIMNEQNTGMDLYFDGKSDLYSLFTSNAMNATITLTTYNGENNLGNSTANLVITVMSSCAPKVTSATVYDENEETFKLTKDRTRVVANQSIARNNFVIQPSDPDDINGLLATLTIAGKPVDVGVREYKDIKPTINYFDIKMTNTRGLPGYSRVTYSGWVPYVNVGADDSFQNKNIVYFFRGDQISAEETTQKAYAVFNARFYDGYFDADEKNKNTFTFTWRYKNADDTNATWSDWFILDTSKCERQNNWIDTNNLTSDSNLLYLKDASGNIIGFDYHTNCIIEYKMSDLLTSFENTGTLNSAVSVFSWTNHDVRVTNQFSMGGINVNNKFKTFALPVTTNYETVPSTVLSGNFPTKIIAKGLTGSDCFTSLTDYEQITAKSAPGFYSLDATTLTAKQNNNWITPTCWADIIYPIGSIYMNVNQTNPKLLFGGEWKQLKGKFLVGVDTSDEDFSTSEKIAGGKTHSHVYGVQYNAYYASMFARDAKLIRLYHGDTDNFIEAVQTGSSSEFGNSGVQASGKNETADIFENKANTGATSTLPPYMTVYMWQRTA